MDTSDFAPCPFCGTSVLVESGMAGPWGVCRVECRNRQCGATMEEHLARSEQEAVALLLARWAKRKIKQEMILD